MNTTPGLSAKVELRKAWFAAYPDWPVEQARAQVEALFASIEAEARTYAWRPDYGPDGLPESALPERVVVGANGAYWRDYGQHYSMCPVSDDNDPVEVRAVYVRQVAPRLTPDREALDNAYRERNAVVAALIRTNNWDASLVPAPDADGWWIVYAETPQGQVSWHVAPVDIRLFDGIPVRYAKWDGHTTDEKYDRVALLAASQPVPEPRCCPATDQDHHTSDCPNLPYVGRGLRCAYTVNDMGDWVDHPFVSPDGPEREAWDAASQPVPTEPTCGKDDVVAGTAFTHGPCVYEPGHSGRCFATHPYVTDSSWLDLAQPVPTEPDGPAVFDAAVQRAFKGTGVEVRTSFTPDEQRPGSADPAGLAEWKARHRPAPVPTEPEEADRG